MRFRNLATAGIGLVMAFNVMADYQRYENPHGAELNLQDDQYSYNKVSALYDHSLAYAWEYGLSLQRALAFEKSDQVLELKTRIDADMRAPKKVQILADWYASFEDVRGVGREEMLNTVDKIINDRIVEAKDIESSGRDDYFSTPYETITRGNGDCEDYAILKYFTLKHLGYPEEDLRVVFMHKHASLLALNENGMPVHLDNNEMFSQRAPKYFYVADSMLPYMMFNFTDDGIHMMQKTANEPLLYKGVFTTDDKLVLGGGALCILLSVGIGAIRWRQISRAQQSGHATPHI
ncbi:MAG: hypothetical protein CL561_03200 [Alphaproteobacteria bacterium]|nr:hypothetical protein [Alphaproteobacteria bacterium]|tara:strand:+ start:5133 stop:6008 length:876 start_codon:yes stop_codon:yes gene_type:complete